ncbi:molybdenum cofactor guanylyltransferase MobA [Aliihoeflea sp. PC F10.4]
MSIAGVILAGGRSSRMEGPDKAFVEIDGVSLLQRAIARLAPQVTAIAINANTPITGQSLPVLPDATSTFDGPLAGVLAGMNWAKANGCERLATIAVDTPFFPANLVERLADNASSGIVVAKSGGRHHPVFALWPLAALEPLETFLAGGDTRRVMTFLENYGYVSVDFEDNPFDPFFNINTPQDLTTATRIAKLSP